MNVFVIAMPVEAEAVIRHLDGAAFSLVSGRRVTTGKLAGAPVAVIVSGVGKVNAAAAAQLALDRFGAERILNVGVVGGFDPAYRVADVFAVDRAVQHDFDLTPVNGGLRGTPNERDTPFFPLTVADGYATAVCASGDQFLTDPDAEAELVKTFGATLCDMELGAIAHVAATAGVPVASVKSISDAHAPGRPSPADQYAANLKRAVEALAAETIPFFERITKTQTPGK